MDRDKIYVTSNAEGSAVSSLSMVKIKVRVIVKGLGMGLRLGG